MKVVCDTSSLIRLRKGNAIDCLGLLFESVLIPPAVRDECQDPETARELLAKKGGHLSSVREAFDAMRAQGEGIEDHIYDSTLSQAGEL